MNAYWGSGGITPLNFTSSFPNFYDDFIVVVPITTTNEESTKMVSGYM
jgi:hypothetical protein